MFPLFMILELTNKLNWLSTVIDMVGMQISYGDYMGMPYILGSRIFWHRDPKYPMVVPKMMGIKILMMTPVSG